MKSNFYTRKMHQMMLMFATFLLLTVGGGYFSMVTAQSHQGALPVRTIQKQIPQAQFKVVGQMPQQATVSATKVQRTLPQGKQVKGAYDITINNGNAHWQPQQGQPVMVSITDPNFADGELLDVWEHSPKLPLPEKEGGEWLDVRALWCSERTPIALESRVLRYAPGEECDGRGAALLSAMAAPHSEAGPLRIGILRARKEEAALLSVPEGKALIQVRGFGYEDDGSLKENHRVILRPDRIRLLL